METPTRKFRCDQTLESESAWYILYVRLKGQAREDFRKAKERLTVELGATPSNGMMVDALVSRYLSGPSQ